MRIKSFKVKNIYGIKDVEVEFSENENIICVVDEHDDSAHDGFMWLIQKLFFDFHYYAREFGKNGKIKCVCEKYNMSFNIQLKGTGKNDEMIYNGQKMVGCVEGIQEICYYPTNASDQIKRLIELDFKETLFPEELREYCQFTKKGTANGMTEMVDSIELEFAFGALEKEEWKTLKRKLREYLAEFEGVLFIDGQPLTLNRQGELMFQDKYFICEAEKYFDEDEYARIEFLYWLVTLNFIKRLCRDIGRDGDFPVFAEGLFEKIDKDKDNSLLFEEMRKTGRQVFLILRKHDKEIEKYCDKVIVINDTDNKLGSIKMQKLLNKIEKGIRQKYGKSTQEIKERVDKECAVIEQLQIAQTYLDASAFIEELKRKGVEVSARSCECGSLVAYLLGITEIDPLKWGLHFERFLNPIRSNSSGKQPNFAFDVQADIEISVTEFDVSKLLLLKKFSVCKKLIKEKYNKEIIFDCNNCDDMGIYKQAKMGELGDTDIFDDWEQVVKESQPVCLADLAAIYSMLRPGTRDFIPQYLKNKNYPMGITYKHSALKPILSETYGILLYQEQIMDIFHKLAGYSLQEADRARLLISKRNTEVCQAEKGNFIYGNPEMKICGCKANGVAEDIAEEIWQDMRRMCVYSFCKAHAISQAYLAYQEAWLKVYYPQEYALAEEICRTEYASQS